MRISFDISRLLGWALRWYAGAGPAPTTLRNAAYARTLRHGARPACRVSTRRSSCSRGLRSTAARIQPAAGLTVCGSAPARAARLPRGAQPGAFVLVEVQPGRDLAVHLVRAPVRRAAVQH